MARALAKTAPATPAADPLLAAINHYLFAGDTYDALPADLPEARQNAEFDRLCLRPEAVLAAWRTPAMTREGAVAAVRLAIAELEEEEVEPLHLSLLRAVLGYLEGLRAS